MMNYCLCLILLKFSYSSADFETCNSNISINNWTIIGCSEFYYNHESLGNPFDSYIKLHKFLGIPYAEPPIGDLRFRVTKPKDYSDLNTLLAKDFGTTCVQLPIDPHIVSRRRGLIHSEDCLFLNVWTTTMNTSANNPVMVHIHYGAYKIGSSNAYDGSILALRDVVIVTLNYRLGVFGFFCTKDPESPGNQGLYDQIEALKWVKNNIRLFGGDPNQITLFGQSAGAVSISYLVVSELSYNLFNKAIIQGGSGMVKIFSRDIEYSDSLAHRFATNSTIWLSASKPGICDGPDWIQCLRQKSTFDIIQAQSTSILWNKANPWYSSYVVDFVPCFGDKLFPNSINKSLELGQFLHNITVLIGLSEMEGPMLTQIIDLIRFTGGRYRPQLPVSVIGNCFDRPVIPIPFVSKNIIFNDITNHFIDNKTINQMIGEKYIETFSDGNIGSIFSLSPDLSNSNTERYLIRASASHAFGDYALTCPTVLFGNYLLKSLYFTGKVYEYRLTYANSKSSCYTSCWCNATHSDDIPLVFGFPFIDSGYSDTDRQLSTQTITIITDFAKYGNPGFSANKVWPPYSLESNGETNLKYFELNPDPLLFGRVFENSYIGNEFRPPVVKNCKNFWDKIIGEQF